MEKMVGFLKLHFPVFLLGALSGKMIEISGFSRLIVRAVIGLMGGEKAILAIVAVCALLTHGAGIPYQVLHRVAAMANGEMDTLPHNGAVITLLAVTGLSHRESYKNIFAITCIKTGAVFVVIAFYYLTGFV